jgi:hypothetical protein
MPSRTALRGAWLLLVATLGSGCYHFSFEQADSAASVTPAAQPSQRLVTYKERRPTYLNGFIGTGKVDVSRYCERPVRTELRVTAPDVLLSVATLLIYTPHTLYVTCSVPERAERSNQPRL